jgi:ribonuclease HII
MMVEHSRDYPGYGWEHNRGYPTPDHRRALRELGPTPLHRRSFGFVRQLLEGAAQPELSLSEIEPSESFAPHPLIVESGTQEQTQHLVEPPPPAAAI